MSPVGVAALHPLRIQPRRVSIPDRGAALPRHVGHVVGVGTEEEVGRIHALPVVAVMADEHSGGDRAEVQLPRHPVHIPGTPILPANANPAIAGSVASVWLYRSGPPPAVAGLVHLRPEPIRESGGGFGLMGGEIARAAKTLRALRQGNTTGGAGHAAKYNLEFA